MPHCFFNHLLIFRQTLRGHSKAFTLVELLIVCVMIGTLAGIAIPGYRGYLDKVKNSQATADITEIESKILTFQVANQAYPDNLGQVGLAGRLDPWGRPYQYLRIDGVFPAPVGHWRKDQFNVPVNTDFDLYSNGPDGNSTAPFTAQASRDDIARANNGGFIGQVSKY
jgi:general secretion pathway protein G